MWLIKGCLRVPLELPGSLVIDCMWSLKATVFVLEPMRKKRLDAIPSALGDRRTNSFPRESKSTLCCEMQQRFMDGVSIPVICVNYALTKHDYSQWENLDVYCEIYNR